MLKIEGKTFMNIQEAVQWLLDNNALPFQSSANYVANTEIGLGTIANPSPAKVKIGSLILFADSKIATVTGLTEAGFMVGSQYIDIKDALAYIADVGINDAGHLITYLSDGETKDAGQIKQISSFSINASQHLIANYNDGTSTDLGAIFSGNVNIAGNFTADSIIENMSGYSFSGAPTSDAERNIEMVYAGIVKNGNKLTCVIALNITRVATITSTLTLGAFSIPADVASKLFPTNIAGYNVLALAHGKAVEDFTGNGEDLTASFFKGTNAFYGGCYSTAQLNNLTLNTKYYFRAEVTFLLSDNLAS